MKYDFLLPEIRNKCLVFDIETWSEFPSGGEININSQFETYINYAQIRWFGAYSYKHDELYILEFKDNIHKIQALLAEHDILIGFNSEEFDYPILKNHNLIEVNKKHLHVDCMQILGKSVFKNKAGYSYKNRGELMNYKFKNNSLRNIAETMGLQTQKGEVDYKIFKQASYSEDEKKLISEYLQADVIATSEMFEKLWEYWLPFTDLLDDKNVKDLSWIRSSIASLTYKSACSLMNTEPTYTDAPEVATEEMGGRVIMPKYEEARNVWYIDYVSLYPHIFCMFNLFNENKSSETKYGWHGNDVFKAKGYYLVENQHTLASRVQEMLKKRIELKKTDPNNPMCYAIKIFLNSLYGAVRGAVFEKIHTPNAGWDCCSLGQQIQMLTENMLEEFGFETIYGDTDSLMLIAKDEKYNTKEYLQECLAKVLKKINDNVPFPIPTFDIKIEKFIDYILFSFSDQATQDSDGNNIKIGRKLVKERKGKKKNYLYLANEEIEIVGLPLKKDNATALSMKIFKDVLEPLILKNKRAKFPKEFIEATMDEYLKKEEILKLMAIEYKVKPYAGYKKESQIQAQISKEYFNGGEGIIRLIKNNKIGKVGKGILYCTVDEAIANQLTAKDLDLEKVWNELDLFIEVKPLTKQ